MKYLPLLLLPVLALVPASALPTDYGWRFEILIEDFPGSLLDAKVDSARNINLLIEGAGYLQHGIWTEDHAFRADSIWQGTVKKTALEILPDGSPVIAFSNPDSLLYFAEWMPDEAGTPGTGGSPVPTRIGHWETSVIDTGSGQGFHIWRLDMAVDLVGTPHIVVLADPATQIIYWRRPGSSWIGTGLFEGDTTASSQRNPHLAVDSEGQIHMLAGIEGSEDIGRPNGAVVEVLLPQESIIDTLDSDSDSDAGSIPEPGEIRLADNGELFAYSRYHAGTIGFLWRKTSTAWVRQAFGNPGFAMSGELSGAGPRPHALVRWDQFRPHECSLLGSCAFDLCKPFCDFEEYTGYYYYESGTWYEDRLPANTRGHLLYDENGFPLILSTVEGDLVAYRKDSPTSVAGGRPAALSVNLTVVPNPGSSEFRFRATADQEIRSARVFDVRGRRVASVEVGSQDHHEFEWDGRDSRGVRVSQGIYFVRVETIDGQQIVRKVTVLP